MSYCVNCGVELDDSAKKCALCSTPVINPNKIENQITEKPFSDKLIFPNDTQKRFVAFMLSTAMIISSVVMFFLNVFFIRKGIWSLYAFATELLIWTVFIFPVFLKKHKPYLMWAFNTVISLAYCYVISSSCTKKTWIIYSIAVFILIVSLGVLLFLIWCRRKKRHWTAVTVILLLESSVISLLSGLVFSVLSDIVEYFAVGMIFGVCSLVLMCFFIYCNKSRHVRAWLNKVFNV